jgi:hypothetical protein
MYFKHSIYSIFSRRHDKLKAIKNHTNFTNFGAVYVKPAHYFEQLKMQFILNFVDIFL